MACKVTVYFTSWTFNCEPCDLFIRRYKNDPICPDCSSLMKFLESYPVEVGKDEEDAD